MPPTVYTPTETNARTRLPPAEDVGFESGPPHDHAKSAYIQVLEAENEVDDEDDRLHVRVMGWLMYYLYRHSGTLGMTPIARLALEIPSAARTRSTREVTNANGQTKTEYIAEDEPRYILIPKLGEHYRHYLIRAFRSIKGPTPVSTHPSRPSLDANQDLTVRYLQATGSDHRTAKKHALVRDGFRCMVTGWADKHAYNAQRELFQPGNPLMDTECCHILDQSSVQDTSADEKAEYAGSVLAILKTFGIDDIANRFMGANGIHHLSNIMTLSMMVHRNFDALEIWLEETENATPHEYKVCAANEGFLALLPQKVVAFRTPCEATLPLPDPRLLALHAVCAKVAHISGAAEAMDRFDREAEDICVLAEDGASFPLLYERLIPFAITTH